MFLLKANETRLADLSAGYSPFGMFRHLRRDRPGKEQLWNRLGDSHRQVYRHDFDAIKSTRQERKFEKREAGNPIPASYIVAAALYWLSGCIFRGFGL